MGSGPECELGPGGHILRGSPGCFTPSRQPCHWLNLFPLLPRWAQGDLWNSRPLDTDRKRQRHQPWCNPNQMQPQTHGVVIVGLAKAQRQEIVLEEHSLGWDQPGGAVPLRLLTLLSPPSGPRTLRRGNLWFWPREAQRTFRKGRSIDIVTGPCRRSPQPGAGAGWAHQARGRGQEPGTQDRQNLRPRALALALSQPAGPNQLRVYPVYQDGS